MSIRTVIELNHDYVHEIRREGATMARLLEIAMKSDDAGAWDILRHRFGVRQISSDHHSSDRKLVVNKREVRI